MTMIACIMGTDGSGKTTLAEAVAAGLTARSESATRVWLGADNYLMAPMRWLLKPIWARRGRRNAGAPRPGAASRRVDYAAEIARKNALAARHPWAVRIYLALVWADYRVQLAAKRWWHRKADIIVADRYIFDVAVNLGLTLGWSPKAVVRHLQARLAKVPLPAARVFLRVEPEVSMMRKNDVFDIDYLRLRLSYYDAIAAAFGFTIRDGTLPIEDNSEWLLGKIAAQAARPYVIYVHSNNADVGGADKVLALMARHMRDHGRPEHGCRVAVALRLPTEIVDDHSGAGIPVILHPFERPQLSRGRSGLVRLALRAPGSLWFFWRLFGRERPDIVHLNDLYDFLPALAARMRGIPVVWHIRMILGGARLRSVFAGIVAHLSQASVSVSHAVRDSYFSGTVRGHDALVIHDLGNAALVGEGRPTCRCTPRPKGLPPGERLVVMVGRIEPWKGQAVFVEAVRRLPDALRRANAFALVGGRVEAKEAYFDQVSCAARAAGIAFLGPRSDVPALLRAADISVHASTAPDPFPGVVIESLLAGTATIAAGTGGAVEMIEDGVHGRLTPPGDAEALAAALADLLSAETAPRPRFGAAARKRALGLVNADAVDAALAALYARLIGRGSPGSAVERKDP